MIEENNKLLEVGAIVKSHGLSGEVVVKFTTNKIERAQPGSVLINADQKLIIEKSRKNGKFFIVKFKGVDNRDKADLLHGMTLFGDADDFRSDSSSGDELWVDELIGSCVVDKVDNLLGFVKAVEANPASDLLVLEDNKLIPLTFITSVTKKDGNLKDDLQVANQLDESLLGDEVVNLATVSNIHTSKTFDFRSCKSIIKVDIPDGLFDI